MKNEKAYLTFQTELETAHKLTKIAHILGKTQPELLNEICHDFIEMVEDYIAKIENSNK